MKTIYEDVLDNTLAIADDLLDNLDKMPVEKQNRIMEELDMAEQFMGKAKECIVEARRIASA